MIWSTPFDKVLSFSNEIKITIFIFSQGLNSIRSINPHWILQNLLSHLIRIVDCRTKTSNKLFLLVREWIPVTGKHHSNQPSEYKLEILPDLHLHHLTGKGSLKWGYSLKHVVLHSILKIWQDYQTLSYLYKHLPSANQYTTRPGLSTESLFLNTSLDNPYPWPPYSTPSRCCVPSGSKIKAVGTPISSAKALTALIISVFFFIGYTNIKLVSDTNNYMYLYPRREIALPVIWKVSKKKWVQIRLYHNILSFFEYWRFKWLLPSCLACWEVKSIVLLVVSMSID